VLRGGEGENCVNRVLEQGESGLDHGEIVGVAAWIALPPKRSYARPQALEVYIPQCTPIKICYRRHRRRGRHGHERC
jgi:hypothetical protein